MLTASHYTGLYAGYAAACATWLAAAHFFPRLRPKGEPVTFARPWRELGLLLLSVVGVVLVGQLYTRGYLLPKRSLPAPWLVEAANQTIIFAPLLLFVLLRSPGAKSAWLRTNDLPQRLGAGVMLAGVAALAYMIARGRGVGAVGSIAGEVNPGIAAQVLWEDVAIAAMLVRIGALLPRRWMAAILVGALFAGGHIPAKLAENAPAADYLHLIVDFALACGVILVLQRQRDIIPFWCVHTVMDASQFIASG